MCGRFALVTPPTALRQFVEFVNLPNIEPRYNITPGQPVSLIRGEHEARLDPVQWGLVPGWARADYMSRPGARPQINARAETVQDQTEFQKCFSPPPRAVAGRRVLRMGTKIRPTLSHPPSGRAAIFYGGDLGCLGRAGW